MINKFLLPLGYAKIVRMPAIMKVRRMIQRVVNVIQEEGRPGNENLLKNLGPFQTLIW